MKQFFTLSILDKYLLKKYLFAVFYCVFIFIIISVSIDYSEKTDDFANPQLSQNHIIEYYLAFIPSIVSLLLSIFVFIATIFFTAQLASKTEFIPMFSSGINMAKILKPYFFGSIIIALIAWIANFEFLPQKNKIRAAFLMKYVDNKPLHNTYADLAIKIDSNKTLEIKRYETFSNTGFQISIYETHHLSLHKISRADTLIWDTLSNTWLLKNVRSRTFLQKKETLSYQPLSTLHTFLKPADLNIDPYLKEKLSKKELKEKIAQEQIKGSAQINAFKLEYYKRDASPFSIIILTLIAAIMASKKIRGGSGLHLAIGLLISSLYVVLDRFSAVFSTNSGLNPLLAAWLPNIIFAFITLFLYSKSQQ